MQSVKGERRFFFFRLVYHRERRRYLRFGLGLRLPIN